MNLGTIHAMSVACNPRHSILWQTCYRGFNAGGSGWKQSYSLLEAMLFLAWTKQAAAWGHPAPAA